MEKQDYNIPRPLFSTGKGKGYYTMQRKTAFSGMDNDLAVENMINDFDMTMADIQDIGDGSQT